MEITIVGSGTVVPEPDRVCASVYVDTGKLHLLLDCGPGAVHHLARFELDWPRITHVALTHFHTDHIGDLPILLFALKHALPTPRREPLTVLGPPGTGTLFERLATAFGDHVLEPGFPVRVRDLAGDAVEAIGEREWLRSHPTPHTDASIAYRLDTPAGSFGYTGDTGFDPSVGEFLGGVDALLAECSLPDANAMDTHLTPSRVAALADVARPGRLLLTHIYPQLPRDAAAGRVGSAGWGGETIVVDDGMRFRLP